MIDPDELQRRKSQPANVPCNGCRACCIRDSVPLQQVELVKYQHMVEGGRFVLQRKSNGECVYLTPRGCGIHQDPPDLCKRFDCRILFLDTPKAQRRIRISQNPTMAQVYEAGKRRLKTLP